VQRTVIFIKIAVRCTLVSTVNLNTTNSTVRCTFFIGKPCMDKLKAKTKRYERYILGILTEYAKVRYSNLDAKNELIVDKENHRYQVVTIEGYGYGYLK
jgi:hypothetical protein